MESSRNVIQELQLNPEDREKYNELKFLFDQILEAKQLHISYKGFTDFNKEMQNKYPIEVLDSSALFLLIKGSSPQRGESILDLPGGEMEDFIRNKMEHIEPVFF